MNKVRKKYKTIVIDFPWHVKNNYDPKKIGFGVDIPYATMTDKEVMNFPIIDFADDDCDFFIWVTQTTLPMGLDYLKKHGFKYHALITWDKVRGPVMLGLNRKSEMCIYGYRGHMGLKQKGHPIDTVFRELRGKHSVKPQKFYQMIQRGTKEPRIDIFARKKHIGFDAWGNQVDNTPTLLSYSETSDIKTEK